MAKYGSLNFYGTKDGIIYYHSNGMDLSRTVPAKVKQNKGTKKAASVFGMGNNIAALLRPLLKPLMVGYTNRNLLRPLQSPVCRWLRTDPLKNTGQLNDLPFISGFQFNTITTVTERLKKPVTVTRAASGGLEVAIPALVPKLHISAKAGTIAARLKVVAATVNLATHADMANHVAEVILPYNDTPVPAQQLAIPVSTAPGNLTIVTMAIQYITNVNSPALFINDEAWTPAGIIGAFWN